MNESIDEHQMRELGELVMPLDEVADFLCMDLQELQDILESDNVLKKAYYAGIASARQDIRRSQMQLARDGNYQMLIHLGKEYLNQCNSNVKTEKTGSYEDLLEIIKNEKNS